MVKKETNITVAMSYYTAVVIIVLSCSVVQSAKPASRPTQQNQNGMKNLKNINLIIRGNCMSLL